MKRGKDEEKSMGPMFPRLHVNDTEKGGPRAPPRNKMALYEQLSIPSQRFNGLNLNPNSLSIPGTIGNQVRQEPKKRQEEDDFRVPIFDQQSGTNQNRSGKETETPFRAAFSGRFARIQKENSQEFAKSASNQSTRQNNQIPLKEMNESSSFRPKNANLRHYRVESLADNSLWGDSVHEAIKTGFGNASVRQEVFTGANDPATCDAVSETSMVDSICGVDISPDDVVGIIGQKHFWKARRAIVNQQRVFAVQVFELHRLIKVQRLIAGSPQLLVEDHGCFAKLKKVSPIKKIPIPVPIPAEYVLKPTPAVSKCKDGGENETEFSAENAVGKASLSSVQNGSRTTNCRPFSGNALPDSDLKMGSWGGFNQIPGHQWLIPVMTPSEGLVYKPYPGPGFMSPVYGPDSTPMIGHNFANYGFPPFDHDSGGPRPGPGPVPTGVHPFAPPASHGYFPPYGMPMGSPVSSLQAEYTNPFNQSSSNVPIESVNPPVSSLRAEHTNPFNQSSSNVPIEKSKFRAPKDSEVQASTASSRSDQTRGRNPLPLFPTEPAAEPTRVIRVVPHNARSATASVARIFRSIQEERKQYDSG